ncbi:hypothetical protein RGR602_PB00125 (plasmid) [Rhizobium gallicum bv. gallicum R602sp]|uniref:Uncharacterized protein n=1 Tax=Rhizobium gallicum bv. gallicum R602sp TaxID=1041138 RepID=A0A0B4X6F1_9HYPH|nr:hypothetical protein RGR602_PB00125 [Rhizobium gallicum bv. gallicum R602sp]
MHPHHGWIAAHFGLIVAMPYYVEDYPDMIEPAYIATDFTGARRGAMISGITSLGKWRAFAACSARRHFC